MPICYVLGATDPEMNRIEEILRAAGCLIIHAKKDAKRVHAGNAYEANNFCEIPENSGVIFIECCLTGVVPQKIIDHHRPGDPGYHKGPTEYWEASSLGQLQDHLGVEPAPEDYVLAAMDHCFNAAMKGECPGVSPEKVLKRKLDEVAMATGRPIGDVKATISRFQENLARFQWYLIGGQRCIDIEESTGVGYTIEYLAAQVAATLSETAIILHLYNEEGGRERLHLCGDVSPATARHFMGNWAPGHGLTDIYGNPERGYAGGYKRSPLR